MANGNIPVVKQQPGFAEQLAQGATSGSQQMLPQLLQALQQQQIGQERSSLEEQLSQITQQPQQQPGQQPQPASEATEDMMQSLQSMGVSMGQQQSPVAGMLSLLQQQTPEGSQLQDTLQNLMQQQGIQPQQDQQQMTPFQQQTLQEYPQESGQLPRMQAQQPDPQSAKQQPVIQGDDYLQLNRTLQNQPGKQIGIIDKKLQALPYVNARQDVKDQMRKELQEERKNLIDQQKNISSQEKDTRKEIRHGMKSGLKATKALTKMRNLSERMKDLPFGTQARDGLLKTIESIGKIPYLGESIDIDHLISPERKEFRALRNDLLPQIRDMFGNRINKSEFDAFLKNVPDAFDQPDSRERVIDHLLEVNQLMIKRGKAADQIIAENDGKIPEDLEGLVNQYVSDDLDRISQDIKEISQL